MAAIDCWCPRRLRFRAMSCNRNITVVAAVIHDDEGRVLLSRRPDHKHMGGLWEFPGGKIHDGESPAAALLRELHEELGVEASTNGLSPLPSTKNRICGSYFCSLRSGWLVASQLGARDRTCAGSTPPNSPNTPSHPQMPSWLHGWRKAASLDLKGHNNLTLWKEYLEGVPWSLVLESRSSRAPSILVPLRRWRTISSA